MMVILILILTLVLMFWMNFYLFLSLLTLCLTSLVLEIGSLIDFKIFLGFYLDSMVLLLTLLSVWLTLLMSLAMKNINLEKEYYFIISLMLLFLILCFCSLSMIWFYIFFEIVLIPMILMIFIWGGQMERFQAGVYMLVYTILGSLPLLVILLMKNKILSISHFLVGFYSMEDSSMWVIVFLMVAFLIKFPIYGFHLWLPKAHVEAPISGSMVLAGVLLKLGGYGMYRILNFFNFKSMDFFFDLVVSVSLLGAIYIGLMCICQIDMKMLIAYSSICHMSLVIVGILSGSLWGGSGCLILMLGHGLCSSSLFCLANLLYGRYFSRNLIILKGMMIIFPSLALFWFLASVINMGAPPSMNFLGEILLMGGVVKLSFFLIFIVMMISFISSFYSLFLFSFLQHGKIVLMSKVQFIYMMEYNLIFFHLVPLLVFILKIDLFML